MPPRAWLSIGAALFVLVAPATVVAFPHVVRRGETLAQIAEKMYGRIEMEQVLVAANGLDVGGGVPVIAGMRLEIPAVGHHRVVAGETWLGLALELLGDDQRFDVLAMANASMPWLTPADGQEIIIPYNLRVVVSPGDSLLTIAYRYLGERDKAWVLDRYNHLKGEAVRRGDVMLVPLVNLSLTDAGRRELARGGALACSEGGGMAREAQHRADAELPLLASDVRSGRWIDAISRGNRILGYGQLTVPEIVLVQKALTAAYAAVDAVGLAATACGAWRQADATAVLDPVELSPKILRACLGPPSLGGAPVR